MADVTHGPQGDLRLGLALARLLRRLAALLARTDHDETSRAATDRGLAWAAELARSTEAQELSRWLLALRARGERALGRAPAVWRAIGFPRCAALATALEDFGLVATIGDDARDWNSWIEAIATFEEPAASVAAGAPGAAGGPAAPAAPAARELPEASAAPDFPPSADLAEIARTVGVAARIAEGFRARLSPRDLAALLDSLAPWIATHGLHVSRQGGRIELSGKAPGDAALPEALRSIAAQADLAAGIEAPGPGSRGWWIRLPAADGPHYLFAERSGEKVAIPWHRVVAYGLVEGADRPRVLLGAGFDRIELPLDWLHGKGEGRARSGAYGAEVLDAVGQPHREFALERPRYDPPVTPATPEALQNLALPADIPLRSEAPGLRALVADDSLMARVFLGRLLLQRGIEVDEAEDLPTVQGRLATRAYDLVFLDAEMPGGGALAMARTANPAWLDRAVVLVKDDDEKRQAEAHGFAHVLFKPFAEDEVAAALRALTSKVRPGAH